jgi:hypothetical protein
MVAAKFRLGSSLPPPYDRWISWATCAIKIFGIALGLLNKFTIELVVSVQQGVEGRIAEGAKNISSSV